MSCVNCKTRDYSREYGRAERLCTSCLNALPRVRCTYCLYDFHCRPEKQQNAPILCNSCTTLQATHGPPVACRICTVFAAFQGPGSTCVQCSSLLAKHGNPVPCQRCHKNCAFRRDAASRAKVGGLRLCVLCTREVKREAHSQADQSNKPQRWKDSLKKKRKELDAFPLKADEKRAKAASERDAASIALANDLMAVRNELFAVSARAKSCDAEIQALNVRAQDVQVRIEEARSLRDEKYLLRAQLEEKVLALKDMLQKKEEVAGTRKEDMYDDATYQAVQNKKNGRRQRTERAGAGSMSRRRAKRATDEDSVQSQTSGQLRDRRREVAEMSDTDEGTVMDEELEACKAANMFQARFTDDEEKSIGHIFGDNAKRRHYYLCARNAILRRWWKNPKKHLSELNALHGIKKGVRPLAHLAYEWLNRFGKVNVGVYSHRSEPERIPDERIIVLGAGFAGLNAARQLQSFGYEVIVLEARDRLGGRCHSDVSFDVHSRDAAVDLGASIITGTQGNPITWLVKQLDAPTHTIHRDCPMYGRNGLPADSILDERVFEGYDKLLEEAGTRRADPEFVGMSLGGVMRALQEPLLREILADAPVDPEAMATDDPTVAALFAEKASDAHGRASKEIQASDLLWWNWSNLEYACATLLDNVSNQHWDQDDEFALAGDHQLLEHGFCSLLRPVARGLDVRYGQVVERIAYDDTGVHVTVQGVTAPLRATRVLCTVPLGVLKSDAIAFVPPLPSPKRAAISRLGFGVLNKVVLLFDHVFWDDTDYFANAGNDEANRGWFYIFWNLAKAMHSPVLIALVTGDAAEQVESRDPQEVIDNVMVVLRRIYGADVPAPKKHCLTKWRSDPYARGSYSFIATGATGDDYDALAAPVGDRLYFAGEATSRRYPATTTGAMVTGLRMAGRMDEAARGKSAIYTLRQ